MPRLKLSYFGAHGGRGEPARLALAIERTLTGIGPAGELAAGYEWFRDSELRFFVEADGSLPFYLVRGDGESAWAPTVFVLVGGAFDTSGF